MNFSDDLEPYDSELLPAIQEAIGEIYEFLNCQNQIPLFRFSKNLICVKIEVSVNLPSKGTYRNIDIRKTEPLLIVFNEGNYPIYAPQVRSDRKDFPVGDLPHLFVVWDKVAPCLCLVRGNVNEWFANRRISDVITVARQWLSKASSGKLVDDGDEFDPTRLQSYCAYFVYPYLKLEEIVRSNFRFLTEQPTALLLFSTKVDEAYTKNNSSFSIFFPFVRTEKYEDILELVVNVNKKQIGEKSDKFTFGLLYWTEETYSLYEVNFPKNYGELKEFSRLFDIYVETAIDDYRNRNLNLFDEIPIIFGIKRPKKLIGYEGAVEFFHFGILASAENVVDGKVVDSATVKTYSHREPITDLTAKNISGLNNNKRIMFLGAGSLGSKFILNTARSGNFNISIVDDDKLSPHNMVRHELYMDDIGMNKASSFEYKLKAMIFEGKDRVSSFPDSVFIIPKEKRDGVEWLVDTTASLNVQNWICNGNLDDIPKRCKSEIAFAGQLGLFYAEGSGSNPRIDDLVNYTYFLASRVPIVSEWLRQEDRKREGEDYDIVDVGLGCNSATMVVANDFISFHASIFSRILNTLCQGNNEESSGKISISSISPDGYNVRLRHFNIEKLAIYQCENGSGWEVRMCVKSLNIVTREARKYGEYETGGVFVGVANYKTKTIHVFRNIPSPAGSKRGTTFFFRGIDNLPEEVDYIKRTTGNLIGYVGEWHTHPMGLDKMSSIDIEAVEKLKPINRRVPLPTFIGILSKKKFLPFVFE